MSASNHNDIESNQSKFTISLDSLSELHDPKSLKKLIELGGYDYLISNLDTDDVNGLPSNTSDPSMLQRLNIYGENKLPQRAPKSFLRLCWELLNDQILIMLSIAAVVSLALGLYETFGQPTEYDEEGKPQPKVEWVEGVAIIVAIVIVVLVGAANDYNKERQFVKLNTQKEERQVIVYRSGEKQFISINDLLVGDLIYVETGEIIPADSIMVSGSCECDESSLTGETDTIKKSPVKIALKSYFDLNDDSKDIQNKKIVKDPMLISGAKLLSGQSTAIVTAVGPNSMHGKIMVSLNHEPESTPLQQRLEGLADGIAKFGFIAAAILFFVLFFKFCAKLNGDYKHLTGAQKGTKFLNILITAITIVVVAVPEGLPLAVTLSLAFATTRMMKDGNLVRVLKSCETMGGATAICSDKTGTLTENKMKVVKGSIGGSKFDDSTSKNDDEKLQFSHDIVPQLSENLKQNILTNIILNSTAFEAKKLEEGEEEEEVIAKPIVKESFISKVLGKNTDAKPKSNSYEEEFVGSKTEVALLKFAKQTFDAISDSNPLDKQRVLKQSSIVQIIPFESSRKWGGLVIKQNDGSFRLYVKGASEIVFARCSSQLLKNDEIIPITTDVSSNLKNQIITLAEDALRTLCLAHRDFNTSSWPPTDMIDPSNESQADPDLLFGDEIQIVESEEEPIQVKVPTAPKIIINDVDGTSKGLILDCLVGIQDPLRPGVKEAVTKCYNAGVRVRMVTGDNIITAKAISRNCGILSDENYNDPRSCMEGPIFRKLSEKEKYEIVPKLCVLARSSPDDKKMLVDILRKQGEVVAVTGDGTNDAPALKLADVGFSMGIAGTEVAREASDIILMTDDFSSIVNAIKWGRTVATSIRKFVQFQLTVNVTAVVLTFISAVASSDDDSVLTAVQLLWVNLIMDTLAALALATDKPDENVLKLKPAGRHQPLISTSMWKMILGQSIVQLIITFVLHFAGNSIFFNGNANEHQQSQLSSLTFNTFVWLQFFNLFLTRKLDEGDGITKLKDRITSNNLNFLHRFFSNWYFITIVLIVGGFQVLIMYVGGAAFSIARQTGGMWATAIICGLVSLPAGVLIRIIPDIWVERIFPTRAFNKFMNLLTFKKKKKNENQLESDETVEDNVSLYSNNVLTVNGNGNGWKSLFTRSRSGSSTADSENTDNTLYASSGENYEKNQHQLGV
ncbi:hypothetical protein CANARDRAFT_30486 [[Candida] arabinofermentans NRRL YB-2248]|uniref:Calcium-transporting ATPase n=1 Tax=[Candida] arabinofermentans NRRL YB-2248 TaxID=983967 RepID=A0A1E4STT6_9ASCO|nr:hypothetical protein CANARDRAFT_30486 [[Candida] arabinofermentans NRRL YB-2248]